jgi:hypothetical protein
VSSTRSVFVPHHEMTVDIRVTTSLSKFPLPVSIWPEAILCVVSIDLTEAAILTYISGVNLVSLRHKIVSCHVQGR